MDIYQKTEQFVKDSFVKANKENQIKHFLRTVHWVRELRHDADEAILVAAVAHDIERAYRQQDQEDRKKGGSILGSDFLQAHQERGAEIVHKFLKEQGVSEEFIDKVTKLISKHEEGGNDDQNLIKDADSISFFKNNIQEFLHSKQATVLGEKGTREKFDWMYNRITSEKAKQICKNLYEQAINELNNL